MAELTGELYEIMSAGLLSALKGAGASQLQNKTAFFPEDTDQHSDLMESGQVTISPGGALFDVSAYQAKASARGMTTTKKDKNGVQYFGQKNSPFTFLHVDNKQIDDLVDGGYGLSGSKVSAPADMPKKIARMLKAFGLKIKDGFEDSIDDISEGISLLMDLTVDQSNKDTVSPTVSARDMVRLRDNLYKKGILGTGTSLISGSWSLPLNIATPAGWDGTVRDQIIENAMSEFWDLTTSQKNTIRAGVKKFLADHEGAKLFSVGTRYTNITYGDDMTFCLYFTDGDINISASEPTYVLGNDDKSLFGDALTGSKDHIWLLEFRSDSNTAGYKNGKCVINGELEGTTSHASHPYYTNSLELNKDTEYFIPVFDTETQTFTGKFLDKDQNEVDGPKDCFILSDGNRFWSGYSKGYTMLTFLVAYGMIVTTTMSLAGKTLKQVFDEYGNPGTLLHSDAMHARGFCYGMTAQEATTVKDDRFSRTDGSTLPTEGDADATDEEKANDLARQYADWWAKGFNSAKTGIGETGISTQSGAISTDLPLSITDADSQAAAQSVTNALDLSGTKAGVRSDVIAQTIAEPIAIDDAITDATVVPLPPIGILPPVITPSGDSSGGLWSVYNPTVSEVKKFAKWLWEDPVEGLKTPGDTLKKMFQNPMEAIISLHRIYIKPPTGESSQIQVGYLNSGVSAKTVSNRYVTVSCGSVTIPRLNNNFMDYEGIDLTIYLPFIGTRSLDAAICVGATLTLKYNIDVITGTCVAFMVVNVQGTRGTVYQWAGSMYESVPVTASDMGTAVRGVLSLVGSAVTTMGSAVAGNAPGVATGAVGVAQSLSGIHTNIQSCGSIGGSAGALASRTPYIIMTITQSYQAYNWRGIKGLPDNRTARLGSFSGYVEGDGATGSSNNMTDDEWGEFTSLLRNGIYV